MEEKTILWAAIMQCSSILIAGGVAGKPGETGWPEIQVVELAKRLYEASEEVKP